MTKQYDVVILGGGNAGFGVSGIVSEAGKSVAFVEERDFGGTCPNRGCTPKKVLVAAAHALHEIEVRLHDSFPFASSSSGARVASAESGTGRPSLHSVMRSRVTSPIKLST